MTKHQKHTKLTRPDRGYYSRYEISILGSNCDQINKLANNIAIGVKDQFSVNYVDANHNSKDNENVNSPFAMELIDQISHHEFNVHVEESIHLKNALFDTGHVTLVNGNHEKGDNQIVIIDFKKEASLRKRASALTNVIALVGLEDKNLPEYIKELIPNHNDIPFFLMKEAGIADFVLTFVESKKPPINGLILGGGKSIRMGADKILMDYHEVPQHEYLKSLLSEHCDEVYLSCRAEQAHLFDKPLEDTFSGLGAYGGLLSAFRSNPNVSWFVVACDIPLLDDKTLETLFSGRNASKLATCFYNSETEFPEPLITIWEPKAYPVLLHYLSQGYSCPRKVLINSDVEIIKLDDEKVLMNANTMEERDLAKKQISQSKESKPSN